jgi:linearmycin/streptolysin S transport system permease protein
VAGVRAAVLISLKDLKARIRDRSAIIIGIVVPLGLAFIFSSIFSGMSGTNTITLGVVDLDRGPVAAVFVDDVLGSVDRSALIAVRPEASVEHAVELTKAGTLNATIVIPAGFSTSVRTNRPAAMRVVGNADAPVSAQIARSIADRYAADLNRVRLAVATTVHGVEAGGTNAPSRLDAIVSRAAGTRPPVVVRDLAERSKELDTKSFFAAGMAVFFLFFTVQFGVTSLLQERGEGTLARLLAAPIGRRSILAGKLVTSFVLGLLSMTVLVVATTVLLGASWGDPIGVAVLVVAAILAGTGIMALVATVARTAEQAQSWQSVVAVVLGMLGGTFFPLSQAPGVLSKLTFLAPQAWFLRGLGDLRTGDLSVVWVPMLAMLAFALVCGGLAMTRLRNMAEV